MLWFVSLEISLNKTSKRAKFSGSNLVLRILEKQYLYLRHNLINMTEKKKNTLNNVNLNHKENQNLKHTLSNKLNKLTTLNFGDFQVTIIASHFWISAFHQTFLESYRDRVFEAPLAKRWITSTRCKLWSQN